MTAAPSLSHDPAAVNGRKAQRPKPPPPLAHLLSQLRAATDDLVFITAEAGRLVASLEQSLAFLEQRVEMARARDRRRDRGGKRS